MKTCKHCNQTKELSEFNNHKLGKDGKMHICRLCHQASAKAWQQANQEKHRIRSAEWAKANPDKKKLAAKKYNNSKKGLEYNKNYELSKKYGLTLEQYNVMLNAQNNKCAICNDRHDVLAVDHNHKTGKIRALLCTNCNSAIGKLREDAGIIEKAIAYLRLHVD